jgi:hypothetical protein
LISWKDSFEKINNELDLARKKQNALEELHTNGRISQFTYENLNKALTMEIEQIEARRKALAEKMTSKLNELEKQISTLETFLANVEMSYAAGEITEELHNQEVNALSLGLEATKNELNFIKEAIRQLVPEETQAELTPETAETAEATQTESTMEIVPEISETTPIETTETSEVTEETGTEQTTETMVETPETPETLEPSTEETIEETTEETITEEAVSETTPEEITPEEQLTSETPEMTETTETPMEEITPEESTITEAPTEETPFEEQTTTETPTEEESQPFPEENPEEET